MLLSPTGCPTYSWLSLGSSTSPVCTHGHRCPLREPTFSSCCQTQSTAGHLPGRKAPSKKQVHSHHTKDTRSFLPGLGFDTAGLVAFDSHSVMSFRLSTSLTAGRHKLCLLPRVRLYFETLQLNNKSTYSIAKEAETPGNRICLCFRKRESPKLTQTR